MKFTMPRLTFWRAVLIIILVLGAYATFIRFFYGLGAATHLSDEFPWGIWIGFDVLCGVMLAAGGFTLMAAINIFNVKRFKPVVRPALLTAFLGYLLVCGALLFDLGKPYNIWHPLIMWNPHSVMFEVGWCVTLYTTVLAIEFAPMVFERLRMEKPLRILHFISTPIVILGVLLSTLHQSSLGSLYLIVPEKLYPLWYTPLLPVFFFISAIAVGLAMTIFESTLSARHLGHHLELPLVKDLGRIMVVVLTFYGVFRLLDLNNRGAMKYVWTFDYESSLFLVEIALSLVLPLLLMLFKQVRDSAMGLYLVSVLVVTGFITNRMNIAVTGMERASGVTYFPKWTEIVVTLAIVGVGFAAFAIATKYLPVFSANDESHLGPTAAREGAHALDQAPATFV
jgi:Polysulphide reductase